jgi:aminopeptidase-like protein
MTNAWPLADPASLAPAQGDAIHQLIRELYPIGRSLTGPGVRRTLERIRQLIPLQLTEVPTGTPVFDWTVPEEWTLEDAWLEDPTGRRVVDVKDSSLHVVGYSTPVDATLSLEDLQPHLHSLPEHPDWIPYRTSYYSRTWGFCLTDRVRRSLPPGQYRAVIRSRIAPGSLTLAEFHHQGTSSDDVLIFAHDCHPSLANDNLSGVAVATYLAAFLAGQKTRLNYRILFAPATIGSITWLATHREALTRIRHGLVLSLLGGGGPLHYKRSRRSDATVDRAAQYVLSRQYPGSKLLDFIPWGYDERQFCSPGVNLPMGRLTRTPNGEFPEYHTSGDNPAFLTPSELGESWLAILRILAILEGDRRFINQQPYGEPQLGRRGLYRTTGGHHDVPERQLALLWIPNQSDGSASLLDIAERSGIAFDTIARAAGDLEAVDLLREVPPADAGV